MMILVYFRKIWWRECLNLHTDPHRANVSLIPIFSSATMSLLPAKSKSDFEQYINDEIAVKWIILLHLLQATVQ